MSTPLGDYIARRRSELGYSSQASFARAADISPPHLNQIETGKISLPNADLRRKLARALGVRHVDILIAAGELAEDEVDPPVITHYDPNPDVAKVVKLARQVSWDSDKLRTIEGVLRLMSDVPDES